MSDKDCEVILAAIAAHSAAVKSDIAKLEARIDRGFRDLASEISGYRHVAMDCFAQLLKQEVAVQRLKEECEQLSARVTLLSHAVPAQAAEPA